MRIIGGAYRGRKLFPLKGTLIRPTSDRIRESIFNILDFQPHSTDVLDLFAGTGAMGLEAISRGAAQTIFIDHYAKAIDVIRKNIQSLEIDKQTKIIKWDISNNLNCIRGMAQLNSCLNSNHTGGTERALFSLVFIDPPYNRALVHQTLNHLDASDSLREEATIVVEHSPLEPIPEDLEVYAVYDQRKYGQTRVSFLKYLGN